MLRNCLEVTVGIFITGEYSDRHYDLGIIACYDGKIFKYASNQKIRKEYDKMVIEKYLKKGYNEYEAQIETLKELYKKMSEEELDKEIEKLYETMKDQNRGEVREKVIKLPVKIFFY